MMRKKLDIRFIYELSGRASKCRSGFDKFNQPGCVRSGAVEAIKKQKPVRSSAVETIKKQKPVRSSAVETRALPDCARSDIYFFNVDTCDFYYYFYSKWKTKL